MAITMVAVSLVMTVVVLNFHNPHMNARRPPLFVSDFSIQLPRKFMNHIKYTLDNETKLSVAITCVRNVKDAFRTHVELSLTQPVAVLG